MANPAWGWQEAIGIGEETTAGTRVAPTVWFHPIDFSLTANDPAIPVETAGYPAAMVYGSATASAAANRKIRGTPDVSGGLTVLAEADDIGWLLKNAFGEVSTADNDPYYAHTYTMDGSDPSMPPSLTVHRNYGGAPMENSFTGCHANALEISGTPGEPLKVTVDFLGMTYDLSTASTTGSVSTAPLFQFSDCKFRYNESPSTTLASGDDEDGDNAIHSFTFRIENSLRAQQSATGSRQIREPEWSGFRRVSLTVDMDLRNTTWQTLWNDGAGTGGFVTAGIWCDSGTEADDGTNYSLALTLPAAKLLTGPNPAYGGGADILTQSLEFEGAWDAVSGNTAASAVLVNTTSTY